MFFIKKNKKETGQTEKRKGPTYWERLIYGKGTVAEPWPTAEELWNDPDVQKNIKETQKAFAEAKESRKKRHESSNRTSI